MKLKDYQIRTMESLRKYYMYCNEYDDPDLAYYKATKEIMGISIPFSQVDGLDNIPYVCLRMPTGAGKTLMACYAIHEAADELLHEENGVVVWLVPSNPIKSQTLDALKNRLHAYRQALDSMFKEVNVFDISEARTITRATFDSSLTIIVSTMQALRIEDTEGRKIYESAGELMEHFNGIPEYALDRLEKGNGGIYKKSMANALCLRRPIIVVDEAHNARTDLSFNVLSRINPSTIIEFTATPNVTNSPSNVIHNTSAAELKAEKMIKVPILIETKSNWQEIITLAIGRLNVLSKLASIEKLNTGEYIRPIMLIQAEANRIGKHTITPNVVKEYLIQDLHINEEEIALATGEINELDGIDILSDTCKIRYVITIQALREGWDCPFAYVLCSVAEMHSSTAIEQIIGRIMRMPNGESKKNKELNQAYAYVTSSDFFQVASSLESALIQNGFNKIEAKDYIRAELNIPQQLELKFEKKEGSVEISQLGFSTLTLFEKPDLQKVEPQIKDKFVYDDTNKTLTVYGEFSEFDMEAISNCLNREESKYMVKHFHETIRNYEEQLEQQKSPFDRGERFKIPGLSVVVNEQLEMFEESYFLERKWNILDYEAKLKSDEYSDIDAYGKVGEVDITENGQIKTRCITNIQDQISMFTNISSGWSTSELMNWIDKNINHPDISPMKSIPYINAIITDLLNERKMSLEQLVNDRYRLKKKIQEKIEKNRNIAKSASYQLTLFGDESPVVVTPENSFDFCSNSYPASYYYSGSFEFKRHYFEHVGELLEKGEEFECAQYIDSLEDIQYWIRNLPRKDGSFWLQTSTDKFYPDFICLLKNGKYMAIEYKGWDRFNDDDSKEKRTLGEVWEARSNGECLFVMPTNRDYSIIERKIKECK
jgi:type III restriction enzyme